MVATEIIPNDFWAEFHEDAEFEVKSAVASYFWLVFAHFLGQNFGHFFLFFSGCTLTNEKRPYVLTSVDTR